MITQEILVVSLVGAALIAAVLAWAFTRQKYGRRIQELQLQNRELETTLELERRMYAESRARQEQQRQELSNEFSALSHEALKSNQESFLKLAQEKLQQFHLKAQHELQQREQSVDHMIKPIREALEKTEKQIRLIEQERKEAYGSLTRYLETMSQTQQMLHGETRNLVQALRRPEVRGQWGEITLKRLAELAGMVEHCDFFEQEHTRTEGGNIRPDMVIRMPAGREIVVDVKTPLDAYLTAVEAPDDESRERELQRHARNVRTRVKELAAKAYWTQFEQAPDFVVLFIPGDQFLSAALERDRSLLEDALGQKVILSTPTSLVALLRAIAYGWRQEALAENADRIRVLGGELYKRLAVFSEHLARLGKNLGGSVDAYNRAVGSLERQVLSSARRLQELGIPGDREIESLDPLDSHARSIDTD